MYPIFISFVQLVENESTEWDIFCVKFVEKVVKTKRPLRKDKFFEISFFVKFETDLIEIWAILRYILCPYFKPQH